MAQLVNQNCAYCSNRISDVFDARFCAACGNPVHDACATPPADTAEGRCPTCGSLKNSAIASQVLAERANPKFAPTIVPIPPPIAPNQPPAPSPPPAKEEPEKTITTVIGMLYAMPVILIVGDMFRPPAEADPIRIAMRTVTSLLCGGLAFYLQRREARKRRSKEDNDAAATTKTP